MIARYVVTEQVFIYFVVYTSNSQSRTVLKKEQVLVSHPSYRGPAMRCSAEVVTALSGRKRMNFVKCLLVVL